MIVYFLKELRENLKWAAVIAAAVGFFVYKEVQRGDPMFLYRLADDTLFLAPLAGLLMGVVQSLFETRADNWAFVVHRPVTRLGVFAARSAAGLLLLYGGLGIPCLLAAAWASRPGNLPMPFQARMVLPVTADVLNAGVFYFAGTVVTLRRARWFGSRLLPLGLAAASSWLLFQFIGPLWQAVLLVVAVQCLAALAAWNAFATGGVADRGGAPAFGLGSALYPGAVMVGFVSVAVPLFFYQTGHWQQYHIDRDGNLLHVVWTRRSDADPTSKITDAADRPMPQYEGVDINDPAYADRFVRFGAALVDDHIIPWPHVVGFGEGFRDVKVGAIRLRSVAPPGARVRSWCVFNVPRRVIELYDPVTRALEGTVGPAGFTAARAAPARTFPGTPLNPGQQEGTHTLAFPSVVYWMELDRRGVRPIFTAAADDPVFSAIEAGPQSDPSVIVGTRQRLTLLKPSGEVVFSIPLPAGSTDRYFQATILPTNQHVVLYVGPLPGDERSQPEYLEFATDGRLVRRTELPKAPDLGGPKVPQTAIFAALHPLALRPLLPLWVLDDVFDLRADRHPRLFHAVLFGSAVLSALATVLLGRRYGFGSGKNVAWAAANLLLGPAGVAVMLGLNERPAREPCPTCGRRRFVGRRDCSKCGAPLPPPQRDGREIFEPAEALVPVG